MKITWSQITPTHFEELCSVILEAVGFTDIKWYGKSGGDKGRDLTAKKEESPLPSTKRMAKWVVQCKRYVTKPPTKRDVQSFLDDAEEHSPDNVLLIVTHTLSANTKDWIETVKRNRRYRFDIEYWEELDLERESTYYRSQISERLPGVLSQAAPLNVEEVIKKKQYVFSCREVDQIEIVALDKPSLKKAREDVIEFINFLRDNNVDFDWQQKKKRRSRKRAS
jgi:Restriction endonuclease